jgi:LytS/YehU family sensor histidine kinase
MLDDLITYLRAALPHLRESGSVLGKEIELARAYLNIIQVRLGDRLSFSFDSPAAHADSRIPPMLLLPLIDHALARSMAAGSGLDNDPGVGPANLVIMSAVANGRLQVTVTHSGDGFTAGDMAHLKHIGERIDSLYGDTASFGIGRAPHGGTRAIFEVPHEVADDDHR